MMLPALILTVLLQTSTADNLLKAAQASLIEGQWQTAADTLDELVATTDEPSPEMVYDRGIAHYHLGQYDIAAKAFEDAMVTSENQTLRSHSAFNYGNSIYQQTMQDLEGTGTATSTDGAVAALENAKQQIKQALESYRTAIKEDGSDMDARANGEFAWKMLQQLDQMQEQMEQQQEQQQGQQQDEESAKEQAKDQQSKDDGESEQEQDSERSKERQQDGEKSDEQQDGEQSSEDQEKQDGEQSKDQQQQQDGEQPQNQQKQHDSEQTKEQGSQEQEDTSKGELETNEEEATETEVHQASEKKEGNRLSKDEAARLLQLVRDKEQERRKALAARRAARRVPVDKDW